MIKTDDKTIDWMETEFLKIKDKWYVKNMLI